MNPDEFSQLLSSRHAVRDFKPEPIPQTTIDAILEDARACASWSNTRPYAVAVAQGEQLRRISASYLTAFEKAAPIVHKDVPGIVRTVLTGGLPDGDFRTWKKYPPKLLERSQQLGKAMYTHIGIARRDSEARDESKRDNLRFFGAPAAMFFFVHKDLLPFSAMDAGIVLQTIMLSATAHGVGTCPLGVMATWRHPLDAEFSVPKDYKLITGLALGYANDSAINSFRAPHPPVEQIPAKSARS
ncbi:MAG: nitroreductase [Acidipropionibacterium sp.]|nr:nitroreductase [Acidipropionibacterium sp.]